MSHPFRRAARFAAVALCLGALPSAAAVVAERTVDSVSSPFGTIRDGWAGALSGRMLGPGGLLHPFMQTSAFMPEAAVVQRLAPVAVALELSGVNPDDFDKLSPEIQAAKVAEILPASRKLVVGYADQVVKRAGALKEGEDDGEVMVDMEDVLRNYAGYLDGKAQAAFENAQIELIARRDRRIVDRAETGAKSLGDPASPDAVSFPAAAPEPLHTDMRLTEIKILSGSLKKGWAERVNAVERSIQLATTGEPDEAVQKAAIRLIFEVAEIHSRKPTTAASVHSHLTFIANIAMKSPFPNVQSLAIHNLLDNNIAHGGKYNFIRHVWTIALASPSPRVKEEAISLLLREIRTTTDLTDKTAAGNAIDAIKAGLSPDPLIAKAPEAKVRALKKLGVVATASIILGGLTALAGNLTMSAIGHAYVFFAEAALFAIGGILFLIRSRRTPWYRKDE